MVKVHLLTGEDGQPRHGLNLEDATRGVQGQRGRTYAG